MEVVADARAGAARGVLLDTNGNIEDGGLIIGFFRFLEPPETEAVLRAANVAVATHECPWVGPVRGALGWVRAGLEEELLPPSFRSWSGWAEARSSGWRMESTTSRFGR
jgi:hypothetical protein